jgi:hypothetical protein
MRRLLITLSVLGFVALTPESSQAGYVAADSASCTKYSDGSGYCSGTMRGFRQSSGTYDQAIFYVTPTFVSFNASLAGTGYGCMFSTTSVGIMAFATAATQTNGYFLVSWDSNGYCGTSYYYQGSSYSTNP